MVAVPTAIAIPLIISIYRIYPQRFYSAPGVLLGLARVGALYNCCRLTTHFSAKSWFSPTSAYAVDLRA